MKLTLLFKKSSFYLFFALFVPLSVFSQTPPHIIASSNITTVTFCSYETVNITVKYNFYNAGGTTATIPFLHVSSSGNLGMEAGDYSPGSNFQIPPGQTLSYSKMFSQNTEDYPVTVNPTDYTQTFYLTCAQPGATYESATIHLLTLPNIPSQINTDAATNVTATSATLNGNVINLGQCPQESGKGFQIRTNDEYNIISTGGLPGNFTGPYSYNIQGLTPGTTYYCGARLFSMPGGDYYPISFTTPDAVANDLCANAAPLSVSAPAVQGSLTNATNGDVFYNFTPTITGSYYITIDNFGTPGNIDLAVLNGCNGAVIGSGTSASLSTETAAASLVAGTTYYVSVIDADLHRDTFNIRIEPPYPILSTNATSSITINDYFNDTFSASKSFTLSGIDLNGAPGVISATSTDASFELSLDNSSWSSAVNINYNSINLGNTLIYVRMPAQSLGTKTGTITFSGGGVVAPPVVTLTGTAVLRPPTVYANGTSSLNFGTVNFPLASSPQSFNLSGIRLVDFPSAVVVSVSGTDFQVSPDNVNWAATASIPYTTETLSATVMYVRLNAQALGSKNGTITFSAPGLSNAPTIAVSGTSILATPDGLTATPANTTFTANWNPVPGATSYLLDVDGNPAFTTTNTVVNLATWNLTSNINISNGISANTSTTNPLSVVGANPVTSVNSNGAFTANWAAGNGIKYWQVSFSTAGYAQIKVSSLQRGPVNGPRDFKLQYRITANGTWNDVPGGTVIAASNITSGVLSNLALPVQCNNKASVYLRWIMTSDTAINGGIINATTNSFISGIAVSGQSVNYVPVFKNYTVNGTSQLVTGLSPAKTYYYRVRAQTTGFTSSYSVNGNTTTGSTTVWDGTQWNPEAPDARIDASVTGTYVTSTNGTFTVNDLTVNQGGSVTVSNGSNIIVGGNLNNTQAATAFVVENNANLIQTSISNGNTGAITVNRTASMNRLDYTYWSSPVAGQNLFGFSPLTLTNRFYEGNESNDSFIVPQSTTFTPAKGYCIRAPNNFAERPALPQTFNGSYTGVPNNGTITIPVTKNGLGFNLIGNPYPSTISTSAFFASNPAIGTLYFWTHKVLGADGDNAANYTSVNRTGATVAPGTPTPNGTIQTGQGFMASTNATTTVTFQNSMRVTNNLGQFYRTATDGDLTDASRIWLNIADSSHTIGQILTGYVEGATNDADFCFDAKPIESTGTQLYNLVNEEAYVIQGRALPFEATDIVNLGFKTTIAGNFTISIDHADGLFAADQDIFLKDELAGTTTDLKAGPYTFSSETGTFNNRFKVVYQNSTLGIDTPNVRAKSIIVYKNNNDIIINSGADEMQQVKVYDLWGRLLFEDNKLNDTMMTIKNLNIADEVVIVKIQVAGGTFTKKVVL